MKQINKLKKIWEELELSKITECLDNKRIPLNDIQRKQMQGDIPYYGANGQVDSINDFIFDEELLLLAEDGGSWGFNKKCSYIIKGKSWVNNHAHVLLMKKNKIDIKFLMYWLNLSDLRRHISGTTRGKLNQRVMNSIKIPLPPLQTQKKIVQILEKAEQLKQQREQSDKLTDEYLKSVFNEMFLKKGFEEAEINKGILETENKIPEKDFPENYFEYIDIASINNKTKKIIETKKIIGKNAPSRAKQLIKFKDVLISTVRPNLNAVAIVPKKLNSQICSTGYCILRADDKTLFPEYLFFISQTDFFINSLIHKTKGANYPAVSDKDIKSLKIPLPPLTLQKKFASIVEKVEKIKEKQKQSKQEINNLFNALMQKAFQGEITA